MTMIPTVIAPESDELFYSWMLRLVIANHADYVSFMNHYVFTGNMKKKTVHYHPRLDSFEHLASLYEQADFLHQRNNSFPDGTSLFLNHTVFSTIAPCLNEAQQTSIILNVFRKSAPSTNLISDLHSTYISKLQYCPECLKEDIRDGKPFYLHLSHNLPTITACPKHHCKLIEASDNDIRRIGTFQYPSEPVSVQSASAEECGYAAFLQEFQNAHVDINMADTMPAIHRKLEDSGYKDNHGEFVESLHLKPGREERVSDFLQSMWRHTGDSMRLYKISDTLYSLYLLFQSITAFRHYLPEHTQTAIPKGFTLLSPYRNDIVRVRHEACQSVFYTSPALLRDGWGCSHCDESLSDKEIFNRIFKTEVGDEYDLLTPYKSLKDTIMVRHNKCGRVYEVKAGWFIRQHRRCICWQGPRYKEDVQKMLDEHCPGYKLIDYTDMNSACTIKCPTCGRIVRYSSPSHFLVRQKCKKCFPKFYEKDDFVERMKTLVGDEYSLVGNYKNMHTKTTFRHNLCGHTFEATPSQFVHGVRCQCTDCRIIIPFKLMCEYVNICTLGRYTIEAIKDGNRAHCILTDHRTGLVQQPLRMTILQEMTRLTPSDLLKGLLPVDRTETTVAERRLCKQNITYFTIEELYQLTNIPDKEMTVQICEMLIARKIKLIQPGMQLYAFSDADLPYEEILTHYFLIKNGHRIGFNIGTRFLNELGVQTSKIDRPSIVTSAVKQDTSVILNGVRYNLTCCKYGPITDDNWPYLEIMYWLVGQKYSRKPEVTAAINNFISEHHLTARGFQPFHNIMGPVVEKRLNYLINKLEL